MRRARRRRRARATADVLFDLALLYCDRFEALIAAGREEDALEDVQLAGLFVEIAEAVSPS